MQKHTLILVLLFTCHSLLAQETPGIKFFKGTWAEAKAEAAKQNKLVFVDCYTTWCGPCKWMAKNVFTDSAVGAFYNSNFICYQIDAEKGDGLNYAKQYNIRFYPTLNYINGSGEVQQVMAGSCDAKNFIATGKTAMNQKENFAALQQRYKNGERGIAFVAGFIDDNLMAGKDSLAGIYADQFFHSLPEDSFYTRRAWYATMYWPVNNDYSFNHVINNKAKYTELYGDTVNNYILEHYYSAMAQALNKRDTAAFFASRQKALENKNDKTEKQVALFNLDYCEVMRDTVKYVSLAKQYVDKYYFNDTIMLNNISWNFYEWATNKKDLELAEQWIKKSCTWQDAYYNNDTYAAVLFKLGKKKEAIKVANHALELGKKAGQDISSTEATLKKYRKK